MVFNFCGLDGVRFFLREPGAFYKQLPGKAARLVARARVGFGFLLCLVSADARRAFHI
jgi:hypothetical protein